MPRSIFILSDKRFTFLKPYENELKWIFIVSSVTLYRDEGAVAKQGEDAAGVRAEVLRADGKKCERCWNYDVSVGQHPEFQTICKRCAEAIQP